MNKYDTIIVANSKGSIANEFVSVAIGPYSLANVKQYADATFSKVALISLFLDYIKNGATANSENGIAKCSKI